MVIINIHWISVTMIIINIHWISVTMTLIDIGCQLPWLL